MGYYITVHTLSIKPQFKKENGELVLCPEIGLGGEQTDETVISVPYFVKSIEDVIGTYKAKSDGFFYKMAEATDEDGVVSIDIGRPWGDPRFKFKVVGMEAILYLPTISLMNIQMQLLYSFFQFHEDLSVLEQVLQSYLDIKKLKLVSFNFNAINKAGDELVKASLGLKDEIDEETGFTRRSKVSEEDRTHSKREISFVELFEAVKAFIEKKFNL